MKQSLEAELMRHLEYLCVDIGPRPVGSPGNNAAGEYVQDIFTAAGLDVEEERFECPAWEDRETHLELDGAALEAGANAFSPPCDVAAPTVAIGTVAELEAADLKGRIGILYGDIVKAPLSAKSWFLTSEQEAYLVRLLEEKKPLALLTVQSLGRELERLIVDWEFEIPSASVPARTGLALLRRENPVVHLRIDTKTGRGYTANIVGTSKGARDGRPRVTVCAHYDTVVDTQGAIDNAAGVAVMLALANRLGRSDSALGLEYIAFSGHEYLPLGDDEYLRLHGEELGQIMVLINFDGAGGYLTSNSIAMFSSSQDFQDAVTAVTRKHPGVAWVEPWPESNHSTFAWRGVTSIAFTAVGRSNLSHVRSDSIEWISPGKLSEMVSLTTEIVDSLQDRALDWAREAKPNGEK
jgi:aminopeptidase YwaD